MSFYLDDDHYHNGPSLGEPSRNELYDDEDAHFVCLNCGGTDSYEDVAGTLCCSSCFTQSQAMTAESTELDIQQVQALAGRTRKGLILPAARLRKGRGELPAHKRRRPLEEYDTSIPFPDLETCLHGIQKVLKHCVVCICDLVGLDDDEQCKAVETTVRSLWQAYLQSWADGAEYYGKLHPEIRFCLRDYFLQPIQRALILRHLSYTIAKEVKEEFEAEDGSISSDDSEDERHQPDRVPSEELTMVDKTFIKNVERQSPRYRSIDSLMAMYWDRGDRGRLECALVIKPSMRLVACLLWMATSRAGVTIQQVLGWIANGALPLQNAFKHCLDEEHQVVLNFVSSAFKLTKLPTSIAMEDLACKIAVACRLKAFAHLHGNHNGEVSNHCRIAGATASKNRKNVKFGSRPEFSFLTTEAVPLMTRRLVRDLGFGNRVLDYALSLMGLPTMAPPRAWLPAALELAHPDKLWSSAHVLAVIAVACKMVPGWETRAYSSTDQDTPPSSVVKKGIRANRTSRGGDIEARTAKRRANQAKRDRFVPYNDEHVRLVANGPRLEGYLDYLEETLFDDSAPIFPKFSALLDDDDDDDDDDRNNDNSKHQTASSQTPNNGTTTTAVRPNPVLFGGRNPNQPRTMWRKQKLHVWYMRLENSRARWADANALGHYVAYSDRKSHTSRRLRVEHENNRLPAFETPEPFHPHYGTLIEYMSYKTNVKPSKIHLIVSELDEEVMELVKRREKTERRQKRAYTRRAPHSAPSYVPYSALPPPVTRTPPRAETGLFAGVEFDESVAL